MASETPVMIQITATHRNGVELTKAQTFGIDPEKITSIKAVGEGAEIEYAETYDRRRQPIVYITEEGAAVIAGVIAGSYAAQPLIEVEVIDTVSGETTSTHLQVKYIVDVREAKILIKGTLTACRRVEYAPGAFVPKVVFVEEALAVLAAKIDAIIH